MTCDPIIQTLGDANSNVLNAEAWRFFGYRRPPRYGHWVQRLRPRWKVQLEKRIMRELLALPIAAHVLAGTIQCDEVVAVLVIAADVPGYFTTALGYGSDAEGMDDIATAVEQYVTEPRAHWPGIVVERLAVSELPGKAIQTRILVGCAHLAIHWIRITDEL